MEVFYDLIFCTEFESSDVCRLSSMSCGLYCELGLGCFESLYGADGGFCMNCGEPNDRCGIFCDGRFECRLLKFQFYIAHLE